MSAALLAALLAAAPPPGLEAALRQASAVGQARLELLDWRPPTSCPGVRFTARTFDVSGQVAVHVAGPGCQGWGWASVRLLVPAPVTTRRLAPGEALDDAVAVEWVERRAGRTALDSVPAGGRAATALPPGTVLTASAVRGPGVPGTPVAVRLELNGIAVEQRGILVSCGPTATCATLPSGRRVKGALQGDILLARLEDGAP